MYTIVSMRCNLLWFLTIFSAPQIPCGSQSASTPRKQQDYSKKNSNIVFQGEKVWRVFSGILVAFRNHQQRRSSQKWPMERITEIFTYHPTTSFSPDLQTQSSTDGQTELGQQKDDEDFRTIHSSHQTGHNHRSSLSYLSLSCSFLLKTPLSILLHTLYIPITMWLSPFANFCFSLSAWPQIP